MNILQFVRPTKLENAKQNLPFYLNISDPEHLKTYPELAYIREATIALYDYFLDLKTSELSFYVDDYETYWEKLTRGKCDFAAAYINHYLQRYFPGVFDSVFFQSADPDFFIYHQVLVLYSLADRIYYCVSAANTKNSIKIKYRTKYRDLSIEELEELDKDKPKAEFPTFPNGEAFQRSRHVLIANNLGSLIKKIQQVEGGDWFTCRSVYNFSYFDDKVSEV